MKKTFLFNQAEMLSHRIGALETKMCRNLLNGGSKSALALAFLDERQHLLLPCCEVVPLRHYEMILPEFAVWQAIF
jgi:hypothetical protein